MIFISLHEAFCELDMKSTYKNAKHDYDLFNSFSTPVLSLFITKIDNCTECRSRQQVGFLKRAWASPRRAPRQQKRRTRLERRLGTLAKGCPGSHEGIILHTGGQWLELTDALAQLIPCDCKARPSTNHNPNLPQEGGTDVDRATPSDWDKPCHGTGFQTEERGPFSRQIGQFIFFAVN